MRLIDFANFEYNEMTQTPDEDLIRGIENLIFTMQKLIESPPINMNI